jgi:hypothetical protein
MFRSEKTIVRVYYLIKYNFTIHVSKTLQLYSISCRSPVKCRLYGDVVYIECCGVGDIVLLCCSGLSHAPALFVSNAKLCGRVVVPGSSAGQLNTPYAGW